MITNLKYLSLIHLCGGLSFGFVVLKVFGTSSKDIPIKGGEYLGIILTLVLSIGCFVIGLLKTQNDGLFFGFGRKVNIIFPIACFIIAATGINLAMM